MRVFSTIEEFRPPAGGTVVTIGNFDGVHVGHQRILAACAQRARRAGLAVIAMTFDPHPLEILAPDRAPARLTTRAEKLALFERSGADAAVVLASTRELLAKTAEQFLAEVVRGCRPRVFIEGESFNFGRKRAGSVETLRAHAAEWGYEVEVLPVRDEAAGGASSAVSSSAIRDRIRAGELRAAGGMLGRPYRITGQVASGDHRGRSIGFPTANLADVVHLLPGEGVYAGAAQMQDGQLRLSAINVGHQPTFGAATPARVEAHLLDFQGDLHGQRLGVYFFERLRGQVKFSGPAALRAQLQLDVDATRAYRAELERLADSPLLPL